MKNCSYKLLLKHVTITCLKTVKRNRCLVLLLNHGIEKAVCLLYFLSLFASFLKKETTPNNKIICLDCCKSFNAVVLENEKV